MHRNSYIRKDTVTNASRNMKAWRHQLLYGRAGRALLYSALGLTFVSLARSCFVYMSRSDTSNEMFRATAFLLLKSVSIAYAGALISLTLQIDGLVGPRGIQPVELSIQKIQRWLKMRTEIHGAPSSVSISIARFLEFVFKEKTTARLYTVAAVGFAACSLSMLTQGYLQVCSFLTMYATYLCFLRICGPFLSLQWDTLLLETLLRSALLALPDQSNLLLRLNILMFQLLIFRLMFGSGIVKILSGDENWNSGKAMDYHFLTQPLPNPFSYYLHHAPKQFLSISNWATLVIEIFGPFLLLMPFGILRALGCWIQIVLQINILTSGNYGYFNVLTMALCLSALDDRYTTMLVPSTWRMSVDGSSFILRDCLMGAICCSILLVDMVSIAGLAAPTMKITDGCEKIKDWWSPLYIGCHYGLFATMTTRRDEVIIEGSNDGETWHEFQFLYKPGDVTKPPPIVPLFHMPRVDWRIWFLPLKRSHDNWFDWFLVRLLEGSPPVYRLMSSDNVFSAAHPPKKIRANIYNYQFATDDTNWWKRTFVRHYIPEAELASVDGDEY